MQMERAVRDGYDLRGVMYWTLIDNFEWAEGWNMKFGLYAWEHGGSQKRTMRRTTPLLADIYKGLPAKMLKHRADSEDASVKEDSTNAVENGLSSRHHLVTEDKI